MNQKKIEANFKCNMAEYMKNMCVACVKNERCSLPLHGKFSVTGESCAHAELMPEKEFIMWTLKNLYGLSPRQCAKFTEKMYG